MIDVRDAALFGLAVGAPVALVVIVALLRGYSISLTMRRGDTRRRWRWPRDDGDPSGE